MAVGAIRAGKAFIELTTNDSKLVKGLRKAQRRLRAFGQSITALGGSMMRLGTALAVPFALGVREFAMFEQAMANVRAVARPTATEFEALTEEARRLGRTTAFTARQAAEAMEKFAVSGFSTAEMLKATEPTLQLAAVGQLEMAEAADMAIGVMKGMGLTVEEFGHTVDVMAKAAITANMDVRELSEAFKVSAPNAKKAGMSLEQLAAAVQVLQERNIKAEAAGVQLRGIIASIVGASGEAETELKRLGVTVLDAAGDVRPMVDILRDFKKGFAGLGGGQQLKILNTIFGKRQMTGAGILIDNVDEFAERIEKMGDATGTRAQVAKAKLDSLWGSTKILLSALQDVAIELGGAIAPELREFVGHLTKAFNAISTVIKENKALFVTIGKVAIGLILGGAAFIALGVAIQVVAFALGGFLAVITTVASSIAFMLTPLGAFLKLIDTGVTSWFLFTNAGNDAFDHLKKSFFQLGDVFGEAWGGIVDALKAGDLELAGRIAMAGLDTAWAVALNGLSKAWLEFTTWFGKVWDVATADIAKGLVSTFTTLLKNPMFQGLVEGITGGALKIDAADIPDAAALNKIIDQDVAGRRQNADKQKALALKGMDKEVAGLQADLAVLRQMAADKKFAADFMLPGEAIAAEVVKAQANPAGLPGGGGGGGGGGNAVGTFSADAARLMAATATNQELEAQLEQVALLKQIEHWLRERGALEEGQVL